MFKSRLIPLLGPQGLEILKAAAFSDEKEGFNTINASAATAGFQAQAKVEAPANVKAEPSSLASQGPATSQVDKSLVVCEKAAADSTQSDWDTYRDWSVDAKQVAPASSPQVKQEHASQQVNSFTPQQVSMQKNTAFAPRAQGAWGLSSSQYASVPSAKPLIVKAEPVYKPVVNQKQTTPQGLADPAAFMSAVINRSAAVDTEDHAAYHHQSPPAPAKTTDAAAHHTQGPPKSAEPATSSRQPQASFSSASAQPVIENGERQLLHPQATAEYSIQAFLSPGNQNILGAHAENSRWPQFPPTNAHGPDAERWKSPEGSNTSPIAPQPQEPEVMDYEQAKSAWNSYAQAEGKHTKTYIKRVRFIPASTSAEPASIQSKAPVVQDPANGAVECESHSPSTVNKKPLSEVVNQDKIAFRNLTDSFLEQGSELETIRQELAAYKGERRILDRQMANLKAQVAQHAETEANLKKAQEEIAALKVKLATFSTPGAAPTSAHLQWLETRIREVERENAAMKPLSEIGRDVRIRFLEESRVQMFHISGPNMDKGAIARGYAAIYHGNWKVDAKVMTGGYLRNAQQRNFSPLFKILYGNDAVEMRNVSEKMSTAMEAWATIQTSPACNSTHRLRPVNEVEKVKAIVRLMSEKYKEMGSEIFEADRTGHATHFLAQIQEAMVPIMKHDRRWHQVAVRNQHKKDAEENPDLDPKPDQPPITLS